MTTLREAAQQALEALDAFSWEQVDAARIALRAALAQQAEPVEPVEPVAWQCREHGDSEWFDCGKESYGINPRRYTYRTLYTAPPPPQRPAESVPEPYTDDVTRLMRDAGMTFHLGLPHKAVVEQMTRVVDLVYAEASIKAAQQFAAPPQRKPLTEEEIDECFESVMFNPDIEPTRELIARAIEAAHGIKEGT